MTRTSRSTCGSPTRRCRCATTFRAMASPRRSTVLPGFTKWRRRAAPRCSASTPPTACTARLAISRIRRVTLPGCLRRAGRGPTIRACDPLTNRGAGLTNASHPLRCSRKIAHLSEPSPPRTRTGVSEPVTHPVRLLTSAVVLVALATGGALSLESGKLFSVAQESVTGSYLAGRQALSDLQDRGCGALLPRGCRGRLGQSDRHRAQLRRLCRERAGGRFGEGGGPPAGAQLPQRPRESRDRHRSGETAPLRRRRKGAGERGRRYLRRHHRQHPARLGAAGRGQDCRGQDGARQGRRERARRFPGLPPRPDGRCRGEHQGGARIRGQGLRGRSLHRPRRRGLCPHARQCRPLRRGRKGDRQVRGTGAPAPARHPGEGGDREEAAPRRVRGFRAGRRRRDLPQRRRGAGARGQSRHRRGVPAARACISIRTPT